MRIRNRFCCAAALFFAAAMSLQAQVVIEPEVVTDSIDVFAGSQKSDKSRALAVFASLVLPGLGHQYLGKNRSALAYFSAEALFICSMIFCEGYSRRLFKDSRAYASMYAEAKGPHDNDYFWKNVGQFMDIEEYNRIMEWNRTFDDKYCASNSCGNNWRWMDEFFKDEYNGIRESATRFHVVSSFFLAAMVINRVVAFIDIRRSTKYKGVQGKLSLELHPHYSPSSRTLGLAISGNL